MYQFFTYYTLEDKNQAFTDEEDLKMLDELPIEIRTKLFCEYLYEKFLNIFKEEF